MTEILLRAKLQIPPPRSQHMPRPRLMEAFDRGLEPGVRLTVVAAPAGYGKTTALAQWAHSATAAVAWVALDPADDDFLRFFRYLAAAWEAIEPSVIDSAPGVLLGALEPAPDAVLTALINHADRLPRPTAFVFDGYHHITEAAIHQGLTFLLDPLPPSVHLVLAGRGEPPLPLARYRARGELQELGVASLRFEPAETEAFLRRAQSAPLSPADVSGLHAQLEGWIAGLHLVSLSLRRDPPAEGREAVESVSGRQRFIADYFRQEVLAHRPLDEQRFMLHTSILDRLSGPLCAVVTGRADSQAMLEQLEQAALFLAPLDDRRDQYRYHPLFAELLREELGKCEPALIRDLHRRAARWFVDQDRPEPAFDHAIAAQDGAIVAEIADRYFEMMLHVRELKLLRRWLDAVPAAWHLDYPVIGLIDAGWLAITGSLSACERRVDAVERHLRETRRPDRRWQLARVNTVRCQLACFQGDLARAEPLAAMALRDLPTTDHHYRANIHISLGDTYRNAGYWDQAHEHYQTLLALTEDYEYPIRSIHVYGALADLAHRQGHLRRAADLWRQAVAGIEARDRWGRLPLHLTGWVYLRRGEISYEWNQLSAAQEDLARGLQRAELGGDVRALIAGHLLAGRLALADGAPATAADHLEQARPLVTKASLAYWTARFGRQQLEVWLAQNRLRAAANWSDRTLAEQGRYLGPDGDILRLTLARFLIIRGDARALQQSIALLEPLGEAGTNGGRLALEVEALALLALAYRRRGHDARAFTAVERALRLAQPEGYIRLFVDLGLPMAHLLQAFRARQVMPQYVATLLGASAAVDVASGAATGPLPEPLTRREAEILRLLAAGLTNQQIGAELTISALTVKKHASNIYAKLGVRNRAEAGARARKLGLLT